MINIHHLKKRFGELQAVNDLSLTMVPGEILGVLGPNGAGKSTTMRMLAGYIAPDAGGIEVYGINVAQDPIAAQKLIGYLPEGAPCYEDMSVEQFLLFISEVRGFTGRQKKISVWQALEKMDLTGVRQQTISTLSKGFKRRVGLAQAILHDPKVLILDEPTDGLDPNQKHQVRRLIAGLASDKIVIISTHILEEVTAVCTRVVIMADGLLLEDCTPLELERRSSFHGAVTVEFEAPPNDEVVARFKTLENLSDATVSGNALTLFPTDNVILFDAVKQMSQLIDVDVKGVYQERGRLDDVFREVTQVAAQ